ncbi:hypothetical protein FPANT_4615 [Fusarium pseudoanthophilum]|uniref:Actin-like ATPase domain-containing protein n=1 Tax=Fusarium pseudoanthophilum TaxID=48495 RepID=A0A8H5UQR1_9HYPO|nr:hypothetical protein FPANT_4615 [Fusarium pseudoanthophilum]
MASSSMTPQEQRTDRRTVLAGIDFGTTFSAICYAFPEADGQFHSGRCQTYQSSLYGSKGVKIPTRYPKGIYNGPGYDEGWLEWFKLSIPHNDDLPKDVRVSDKLDRLTKEREAMNISAVEACSKYLGDLWKQCHEKLDKDANFEITVTVPAIWPEDARERLLRALRSRSANILGTNVRLAQNFVTESEAAAIALLSASANPGSLEGLNFKANDTVIICDCGGGTTAGAALLDDGFIKLLRAKTQAERPKNVLKDLTDKDYNKFADRVWHNEMKIEHSVDKECQTFDLPHKFIGKLVGQSTMEFTGAEIHGVFDPVVNKIANLIESEMAIVREETGGQATHVVIAGGFGRNSYLHRKIEDKVRSVSPSTHTNQYKDDTGWTSVARGAVLHAIQRKSQSAPSIEARASGESYGVGIGNGGTIHWLVRWVGISFMRALVEPLADYLLPGSQCVILQTAAVFWIGIGSRGQVRKQRLYAPCTIGTPWVWSGSRIAHAEEEGITVPSFLDIRAFIKPAEDPTAQVILSLRKHVSKDACAVQPGLGEQGNS